MHRIFEHHTTQRGVQTPAALPLQPDWRPTGGAEGAADGQSVLLSKKELLTPDYIGPKLRR